jgi:hypothetical protein
VIKVKINGYKSIETLQLNIKPVTVLVGPPNSGKSNILEALYIAGLPGKLYMAEKEYEKAKKLFCERDGSLGRVTRLSDPLDIFPDYMYEKPVIIDTLDEHSKALNTIRIEATPDTIQLSFRIPASTILVLQGKEKIDMLETGITLSKDTNYCLELDRLIEKQATLRGSRASEIEPVDILGILLGIIALSKLSNEKIRVYSDIAQILVESRLYSYSRYMLDNRFDSLSSCKGGNISKCKAPRHVLAEDASNIAWIAYRNPQAIVMLNEWLNEKLGTGVEVLVKNTPAIEFYEKPIEMKSNLVSDGIKRALYYVLALASSISYAKQKKSRLLLLLEEPEAKLYPYIQDLLLHWLIKTVENGIYTVITTHNPYLIDVLAEEFTEDQLAVYYVYKKPKVRRTRIAEITKEKLAELTAYSPGDLLAMTPEEIVGPQYIQRIE